MTGDVAPATDAELLTLDQLMELLQQRLRAWELAHPTANPAAPPLLEWFITDEDAARFVPPPAVARSPVEPIPLQELRRRMAVKEAALAAARQRLAELDRDSTLPDRAATRLRPADARRQQDRADRRLTQLVQTTARIGQLEHQVALAAARVRRRLETDRTST